MNPQELDAAIEDVLARPEFAWRLPRERLEDAGEGSILGGLGGLLDGDNR